MLRRLQVPPVLLTSRGPTHMRNLGLMAMEVRPLTWYVTNRMRLTEDDALGSAPRYAS